MKGAIKKAAEIAQSEKNAFVPQQFENPANPEIHRRTTAEEIWIDTDGKADIRGFGVGTGGTITGDRGGHQGRASPRSRPSRSSQSRAPCSPRHWPDSPSAPGPHKIQGIGAGFVPKVLNLKIVDEVIAVDQDDAIATARRAAREEGLFVGISSGAALAAAMQAAARPGNKEKVIVVIIPSFGKRYLSSPLFADITG